MVRHIPRKADVWHRAVIIREPLQKSNTPEEAEQLGGIAGQEQVIPTLTLLADTLTGLLRMVKTDSQIRLMRRTRTYMAEEAEGGSIPTEQEAHIQTTRFLMAGKLVEQAAAVDETTMSPMPEVTPRFTEAVVAAAHSHQIIDTVPVARVIKA